MRILITGICGFVGRWLAECLLEHFENLSVVGVDNLSRLGSEGNLSAIRQLGIDFRHSDVRCQSDLDVIPRVEWVIDAAAITHVTAGIDGQVSARQLVEGNLVGTLNLLELCRRMNCGLILLSTSRVYSIRDLAALPLQTVGDTFRLETADLPAHVSSEGISELFPTRSPTSIYGATKLASERMAQEYSEAFGFPLRINRCGVMAGAGQFGRVDQGIFSYWITSHRRRAALKYLGFGGKGWQVRDCLHPRDLATLVFRQLRGGDHREKPVTVNVGGGIDSARSLAQLTQWCDVRFGQHLIGSDEAARPFDLPWIVLDTSLAREAWSWYPTWSAEQIFDEIANAGENRAGKP